MSNNPINLAVRFALEMAALVALAMGGAALAGGVLRIALAVLLPVIGAAAWGTFRVPGDASSKGGAPVPVPGFVRLVLELALFAAAVGLWWLAEYHTAALVLALVVVVHYAVSYDRILWLLRQ